MPFSGKNDTNPAVISATGYAPYVHARAEKACAKPQHRTEADRRAMAIKNYWKREHRIEEISDYANQHEKDLFRSQWEYSADKKNLYNRVQWEMDKITTKMNEELEKRRKRLSELLKQEETKYLEETMQTVNEAPQARQQRMIERYSHLKRQKEMKRQEVVKEKREQQFKQNCDELRGLMSRKLQVEIAEDGKKILLEKEEEARQKDMEDHLYHELWKKDIEAKRLREEQEEEDKRKREAASKKYVVDQITAKKLDSIRRLRQKEEEAEIMAEQKRLLEIEEAVEKEKKKIKQMEMKNNLDECLKMKLKQKSKDVQDDLIQDLFFLKQITEQENEKEKNDKKRALLKEQHDYMKYLKDQVKREMEFEKNVDKLYQDELEKMWKKREEEWAAEKDKRRQLEKDVMNCVKEQILNNMEKGKKIQEMNQSFAQKILEEDEEDKRINAEKLKLFREKNAKHQRELLDQIRKKGEKLEVERQMNAQQLQEIQCGRDEEETKIQKLLSEMKIDHEHPYRVCRRELFNDCSSCNICN